MPRNDSALYSGLTAPIRRQKLEESASESRPDARAEMVLDEIAKLKAESMDISKIVLDDTMDDTAKLKQIARMKDHYNDLVTLERRMQKLLGVRP